jgi:amidase
MSRRTSVPSGSPGVEGIDAALNKDHLDVLIAPTMGAAWTTDWVNGDHFLVALCPLRLR